MPEIFTPCPPVPARPGRARFVLLKQKATAVLLTANGTLPELDAALAAENWSTLDPVAHAIKGNALATGDTEVANAAIALRVAAKMSEKDNAAALIAKIKELAKEI